jgi:hypothetical protein
MSRVRVAIAVADHALQRLHDVADACRALGFRADSTLTGVGIFTGSIDAGALGALRSLPDVAVVELEGDIRLHRPTPRSN